MNRFLSVQDDSNNNNDLNVRTVTIDTSAVTDAITVRTETLEASTATLLTRIQILEDISYTPAYNSYIEMAQRRIASDMPYPAYISIKTLGSTHVLDASGDLVSIEASSVDDVWQIVPTF